MTYRMSTVVALLLAAGHGSALAEGALTRHALLVGANNGGYGRVELKYAVSDARNVAGVLQELGGVEPRDVVMLDQPDRAALTAALRDLGVRTASAAGSGRSEVLFYYSGHADEQGLLLGGQRYSYRALRDAVSAVPADVRIVVLDACASGAITRLKGGQRRKPFLVDASSEMRGHVFLTSSSADEGAQESDRIGASFFTHYLVSGLRGAADVSGEGKVTLNEAYQFAFNETLGRTARTGAGVQHPAYEIDLSGTGDVVMTDLRHTSATLVLAKNLSGRCFIRDDGERLVVELYKTGGRSVELGLDAGEYAVRCEREHGSLVSRPALGEGTRLVLTDEDFTPAPGEPARLRGDVGPVRRPGTLAGRSAFSLHFGLRKDGGVTTRSTDALGFTTRTNIDGVGGGLSYTHWLDENLAVTLTAAGVAVDAQLTSRDYAAVGIEDSTATVSSLLVGLRRDFPGTAHNVRPYAALAVGPVIGVGSVTRVEAANSSETDVTTMVAFGARLGGGVDFQINRHFMLGVRGSYNFVTDFDRELVGQRNYSGFEMGLEFSFPFGRGRPAS